MGTSASRRKGLKAQVVATEEVHKENRVLVLGTHHSGKSTFCRSISLMNIITNSQMDRQQADDYLRTNRRAIREHTWRVSEVVAAHLKEADFEQKSLADASAEELAAVLSLLKSPRISEALELAKLDPATANLMIHAKHFIDRAPLIFSEDFDVPSVSDVMYFSATTTGVVAHSIAICPEGMRQTQPLRVLEVGGMRSERKMWIHCFSEVVCVVFTLDVSDCVRTSVLFEDSSTNRWHEAMTVLDKVLNFRWIRQNISVLVRIVLTKCDWLFANYAADEKLEVTRIRDSDERLPPMTASQCLQYLKDQLPTLCIDSDARKRVSVVAVNCVPPQMDILFGLAAIHGFGAGDSVETVIAKERKRRCHLLNGALKEWTIGLPIWATLDTSDLRRLIEAFTFASVDYESSQTDPRLDSLKEPWQVLREVTRHMLEQQIGTVSAL